MIIAATEGLQSIKQGWEYACDGEEFSHVSHVYISEFPEQTA